MAEAFPAQTTTMSSDGDGLGVDSGLLVVVDARDCDRYLERTQPAWDGQLDLPAPATFEAGGALLDVGGADVFPWVATMTSDAATSLEVILDESDLAGSWIPLGEVPVTSGLLLVGAPEMVKHYVPYPLKGVIDARGVWIALTVPAGSVQIAAIQGPDGPALQRIRIDTRERR